MRTDPLLTSFRGSKIKRELCEDVGGLYSCVAQAGQGTKTKYIISQFEGSFQLSYQRPYKREQAPSLQLSCSCSSASEKFVMSPPADLKLGCPNDWTPQGLLRPLLLFHPHYPVPFQTLVFSQLNSS